MAKKKLAGRKDNPKSRKRKIESTGEHQDYKRQHSTPRQAVSAPLQNSSEGNLGIYQRLDDETMKYILEVKSHFDTLMDARARSLLVGNAVEEMAGKEDRVSTDAMTSRVLESLIPSMEAGPLLSFLRALGNQGTFCTVSASPFGSRVIEKLLVRLGELLESESDHTESRHLYEVLQRLCAVIVQHSWEFSTDRNATHVARRLLCVLAGRDVLPAQANSHEVSGAAYSAASKGKGGLAAKMGKMQPMDRHRRPALYPELLQEVVDDLLSDKWAGGQLQELLYHAYGCPWLQALLLSLEGHSNLLGLLVPRLLEAKSGASAASSAIGGSEGEHAQSTALDRIPVDHVQGLMQDRISSRCLEVVMRVVPDGLLEALHRRFLRGALARLAKHPFANFVVQSYLAAIHNAQQVKGALRELGDVISDLLTGRRAGVVASLVAAAGRAGNAALQVDVVKSLSSGIAALQSAHSTAAGQGLAAGLLLHNSPGGSLEGHARLSPVACAALATIYYFPKEAIVDFVESLAELSGEELLHIGADSSGSHALEACLEGHGAAKAKKKLIKKLRGSYGKLAGTPGGSHVVQTAFKNAGPKDKELILAELKAAEAQISSKTFGQLLLQSCGLKESKHGHRSLQSHAESAAGLRNEFAEILGEAV